MNRIKQLAAVSLLTLILSLSAHGGQIEGPGAVEPPPPPPAEQQAAPATPVSATSTSDSTEIPLTAVLVNLIMSLLG